MIYGDDPLKLNNYNYSPSLVAIIQSGNLYVYAMNNPVKYVDENGRIAFVAVIALVGGTLGGVAGALRSYNSKGEVSIKDVAIGATIGGLVGLGIGAGGSLLASSAMGGASLTLSPTQTLAGFSALLKGGSAATLWGVSKDGVNQGIRHFYDYATQYSDRLASIARSLNIDLTIDKAGFERFTSAAMNIVNNYQSIGGLMKATGSKVSYYYNNVIVVTYDGKLQSVMIGSLKYFEKMK